MSRWFAKSRTVAICQRCDFPKSGRLNLIVTKNKAAHQNPYEPENHMGCTGHRRLAANIGARAPNAQITNRINGMDNPPNSKGIHAARFNMTVSASTQEAQ